MNEKIKNILSWILAILFIGSITISFIIAPFTSFKVFGVILFSIIFLPLYFFIVVWIRESIYDFFTSNYFQKKYRKYISKHYESKEQLFCERGDEICSKCDVDCILQYPLRRYIEDSYCKKRVDLYIKEHKLKIDEPNSSL